MRVVHDTNVIVSALLFRKGALAPLRALWRTKRVMPLVDRPCTDELLRVLAYPKFGLDPADITALLEDYLPYTERIVVGRVRVPRCRDADDKKFLVLAAAGHADVLVAGDSALPELDDRVPFAIEAPAALIARFVD